VKQLVVHLEQVINVILLFGIWLLSLVDEDGTIEIAKQHCDHHGSDVRKGLIQL